MIFVNSYMTVKYPLPCCPLPPKTVMARETASFDSIISDSNLLVQILAMLVDKDIGTLNSSISRVDCRKAFQTSLANMNALKMKGIDSRNTLTLLSFWRWIVNRKVAVTSIDVFNVFTRWYHPDIVPVGFSKDCEAELATVISHYLGWTWKKFLVKSVRLMECRFDWVEPFPSGENYNIAAHLIRSMAGNAVQGHMTSGLLSLDLVSCILSQRDMKTVGLLLQHNAESLQRVTLSDLRSDDVADAVTIDISEIFCSAAQLKHLTLAMTPRSPRSPFSMSSTCLLKICRRCPGLECIFLRGWENSLINDADLESLAEACSNLMSINFNGSCDTELHRLVHLGRSCGPRLRRFYMCGLNGMAQGMAHLKDMAKCCTNLTSIDFGYSTVCDEAIIALVENCKSLEFVKINRCPRVTEAAVFAIASCCPNLMELNLFDCRVSKAAVNAVISGCNLLRALFCSVSTLGKPVVFHSYRDYNDLINDWEHAYDLLDFKFPYRMNSYIFDKVAGRHYSPINIQSLFSEKILFFYLENVRAGKLESEDIKWLESKW